MLLGSLLAVPVGFVPTALVLTASSGPENPVDLAAPWTTLGAMVVVIPVVAAVASGMATGGRSACDGVKDPPGFRVKKATGAPVGAPVGATSGGGSRRRDEPGGGNLVARQCRRPCGRV